MRTSDESDFIIATLSLFRGRVEVAITEHKARLTELLQHRQAVQLLEEAKEKDAPERLKVEALCTQYAFKHFKDKRLTCLVSV